MHTNDVSTIFEKDTVKNLFKTGLSFVTLQLISDKITGMSTKTLC